MAYTNNNRKGVHPNVWGWTRTFPASSSATSAWCAGDKHNERYIYYLAGSTSFWRYDTWTDTFQQLASPTTGITTAVSLQYASYEGFRGNCLGATANTIDLTSVGGKAFKDKIIRITAGTGEGQERTITDVSDPIVYDNGIITATNTSSITDSTKKWKINQYIGYQVRIVYGTGQSQIRNVLYNNETTLYFYDANYQQLEPWRNTQFVSTAPYAVPVTTAGSQAHYHIEKATATVDSAWTTTPDFSSSYVVMTGGIFMMTSTTAAPWSYLQYYDVATDTWTYKTSTSGLHVAAIGTDFEIEKTGEVSGRFANGTTTSSGTKSLVAVETLQLDRWANYQLRIVGGTGVGQRRRIDGNNTTTFFVNKPWTVAPDATSLWEVWPNSSRLYFMGNGSASVLKYDKEYDLWFRGQMIDSGQANNMSVKFSGQETFALSSATRNTAGITAVASAPTAGGTGYLVGDILTVSTGGTLGKVRVTDTLAGVVTAVEIYACGINYTTGTGKTTTGGTGTGCTINITSIGTVGRITTVQNHNIAVGDQITIAGCTESAWNTTSTVVATDSLTTLDIVTTATATAAASNSQSTTVLVDSTKNWPVNGLVGMVVQIQTAGFNGTHQTRRIISNTATTITVATITAATNGTSRYVITEPAAFGKAIQNKSIGKTNFGFATGGTATTLVDSSKSWLPNQWNGYRLRVLSGTGEGSEVVISGNTTNTLTLTTPGFTPDATTKYLIMDSFGLATAVTNTTNATITDTTKNWPVNLWAGKRLVIVAGAGAGQEITITSNTATVITTSGVFTTAPDTTSVYCILEVPARSTGIKPLWVYGNADTASAGKYIVCHRGGASNIFDRYDITEETWEVTVAATPQTVTLTTGTQYAYDGANRIYFQKDSTGYVYYLDTDSLIVGGCGQAPYSQGTAILGNRMEILTTDDGLKVLYLMRNTGAETWKLLLWI